jgi:hypothetical protein
MALAAGDHLCVSEERIMAFETGTVSRLYARRILDLERHLQMILWCSLFTSEHLGVRGVSNSKLHRLLPASSNSPKLS